MSRIVEFNVTGADNIHCGSCEQRIARALQRVDGVAEVKASAATQKVSVSIDPAKLTPEQVRGKLLEIGYETQVVS